MKKLFLIFIIAWMFCTASTKAQITLEHTLDSTFSELFYCTDIGNNDFKYVLLNPHSNTFSLYNMNMSPYLINLAIPVSGDSIKNGFTVIYVTKTLFDCDSTNIEYVFETQFDVKHSFRIFRTDGTMLLQVDSANGPYGFGSYGGSHDVRPIMNTPVGAKLFLQKYRSNGVPTMLIYALCGELPVNTYDFSEHDKSYVKIFPNPATMELTFEVNPPNNHEEFQLVIFDLNAREQKRENIVLSQEKYSFDVHNFNSGNYVYQLVSKNKIYQSGKFIVTK